MSTGNRLPEPFGLFIKRDERVSFHFEGKQFHGCGGDTVASALAASDVWLLSRSFKYHRPRGALSWAGQDANTMVQLPHEPNVLADRLPVTDGLKVTGQHYNGSLQNDRDALIGLFSRFMPVGFYYRTFFRRNSWKFWEPIVRKRAGLGRISLDAEHGYYDKAYLFCDVAVVGGGPAGLAAALSAARAGADVLLVDEQRQPGGALTWDRFDVEAERAARVRGELLAEVNGEPRIRVLSDAVCNGWFSDNWLPIIQGTRMYKLRATRCILATGAFEQPVVFRNNDLPGVMLGSAVQRLMRWYGVRPGKRAVVLTGDDHGYAVALDLLDAGVEVKAVVDMRMSTEGEPMADAVNGRGVRVLAGHAVEEALATRGNRHIRGVTARRIERDGVLGGEPVTLECDLLAMSAGWSPAYQLALHGGGRLGYDDVRARFTIENLPEGVHLAGSVNGRCALDAVISDGRRAGALAAEALGHSVTVPPEVEGDDQPMGFGWPIFPHQKGKDFIDFDEDLQVADILNAVADGYDHIELVKRFSTVGMGPTQGRHSALATARLVARATGRTVAETGVTTARPPFSAEKLAHVAGRAFEPERRTPMHHRHIEAGAQLMPAGLWWRPAFYGDRAARRDCMTAESVGVRSNVGIIDVSTLGGLEVRGPDAGELLERMYTFAFRKQPVGRARYVVMTNEQGAVIDDGVACRFHEQHYYVTATTGGVDNVYRNMLHWNARWRLDVDIANVTAVWAGVNIAGPRSREVLSTLCTDCDLSAEGFPYMGVREATVAGIPARLIRVGFVGELGFEIHVPWSYGEALWDALTSAGEPFGLKPFGVETQRLMRLEKGHIIIGQDTDAMAHPAEVHLAWAISRKKPFFIGGRSLKVIDQRPLTRKLAGFVIEDAKASVPEESHLVIRDGQMTGRVTSCYYSPTLGKPIGLAFMAPDQAEPGTEIQIRIDGGAMVNAQVVSLPFYDPDNRRQEM